MRELRALLRFSADDVRPVGTLAEDRSEVWLEFDPTFVAGGLQISPLRLPLRQGLIAHRVTPGAPVPGVFNDARPEGWGLKLLHRAFQAAGRPARAVSPLEELAFLGPHTMGALVFEPRNGPEGPFDDAVELGTLAAHAQEVWHDRVDEALPALVRVGGPAGGARPKALIGLRSDGAPGFHHGEAELPEGWEAWMVKFPTHTDDRDVGRREAAWMAMAQAAGVEVPASRVIELHGVGHAFAVRRFDRPGGDRRLHMLSAAGALDADFRTAAADYTHLIRVTAALCEADQSQVLAMFRLAAFNVVSGNEDDHLKNFAWLLGPDGQWRLAPGFDLTWAPSPTGERATTVQGVGKGAGRDELLALAASTGIKPVAARRVLDQVRNAAADVRVFLDAAGCTGPVSAAAAEAVGRAAKRL